MLIGIGVVALIFSLLITLHLGLDLLSFDDYEDEDAEYVRDTYAWTSYILLGLSFVCFALTIIL